MAFTNLTLTNSMINVKANDTWQFNTANKKFGLYVNKTNNFWDKICSSFFRLVNLKIN